MELEQQIIEAALATVRPSTPSPIRTSASYSLEQWTQSSTSWIQYQNLISIFFLDHSHQHHALLERIFASSHHHMIEQDVLGVQLLLLTMLRTKCRQYKYNAAVQEDPNTTAHVMNLKQALFHALLALIPSKTNCKQLIPPLCSSIVALSVRTSTSTSSGSELNHLIEGCCVSILHSDTTSNSSSSLSEISSLSPLLALQMLAYVPEEVQTCSFSKGGGERDSIQNEMKRNSASVLNCVLHVMQHSMEAVTTHNNSGTDKEMLLLTLNLLRKWIESCNITLVQLHAITSSQTQQSLLSLLVQILSHPNPLISSSFEQILQYSAQAITESLLQPSHSHTNDITMTHSQIIAFLFSSIAQSGFLTHQFTYLLNRNDENTLDDSIRALTNLATTLATEEIDTIAMAEIPGCLHLMELLLQAQSHPHSPLPVAMNILEVWLALQDIPTSERHATLAAPLFQKVLHGVLEKLQYIPNFISWEDEDENGGELDVQEFNEFRRLVKDVLISCYFLLRVDFIQALSHFIMTVTASESGGSGSMLSSQWYKIEAALFSICAAGREICARVKARGGNNAAITADKEATIQTLLQLAQILCAGGVEVAVTRQHPLVLASVAQYLGTFAPVWNVCKDINVPFLMEMLGYLRVAISVPAACEESAQSIKKILIACSSKLIPAAEQAIQSNNDGSTGNINNHVKNNSVLAMLPAIMDGAFVTNEEACLKTVAEGCTRLVVQLKSSDMVQQSLEMISEPVLHRTQQALDIICASSDVNSNIQDAQLAHACIAISVTLRVMSEIIRFCDSPSLSSSSHPLTNVLNVTWPILSTLANSPICRQNEDILTELLSLQSRIFSTVPNMVAPHLPQMITFVVQAYEETHLPCTLDCVAAIVEDFSSGGDADNTASFNQLLGHLIHCTRNYLTQEKPPHECPQVIRAFFDMTKRYLLFCPTALIGNSEFSTIFSIAVACLTECRGERESTRAALNYLTQVIDWRTLKLSSSASSHMEGASNLINTSLAQHGETMTKVCISGLAGASPQMLWPALSECLFSIVHYFVFESNHSHSPLDENSACYKWITLALIDDTSTSLKKLDDAMRTTIVQTLFRLTKDGVKSKPMVKMLLSDFGSICKGEKTSECLLSYSLQ